MLGAGAGARCRGEHRTRSTSTRSSTTRRPRSSSAAAPAGSARRPRPPPWRARRRARTARVRADHRPGAPARAVAGLVELDNTPRRSPASAQRRRRARRDDARHEAHLRRDRRAARRPRRAPSRSWRTPSTSRCRPRSPARRSTWRWRSSASCAPEPRHGSWDLIVVDTPPSVGARLPRRPRAARARSSTAGSSASCWRRRGPGQGLPEGVRRGFGLVTGVAQQGPRRPGAHRPADPRRGLDTIFGGFRERAEHVRAAQDPGPRSRGRRARARRAARGGVLRRAAAARRDAAGRPGAQPGAHHRGAGRLSSPSGGRSRGSTSSTSTQLTAALLRLHADTMRVRDRERHLLRRFTGAHPEVAGRPAPALAGDVHDLDGLRTSRGRLGASWSLS